MPPENLFQFLQQLMTSTDPDATGFAHDEINSLMQTKEFKKGEFRPSSVYDAAHEQKNIPIDMESFAELFELGFDKESLKELVKDEDKLDEIYNTILNRIKKGDAPGGLVAYAFPDWEPGDEPGWRGARAEYMDADSWKRMKEMRGDTAFPFNLSKDSSPFASKAPLRAAYPTTVFLLPSFKSSPD